MSKASARGSCGRDVLLPCCADRSSHATSAERGERHSARLVERWSFLGYDFPDGIGPVSETEPRISQPDQAPDSASKSPLPRPGILALLVFAVAVVVPAGSVDGPWIFDDINLIERNPCVHSFDAWTLWFTRNLSCASEHMLANHVSYWRPLVLASYAVDWWFSGGQPAWFHVANLIVHGLAGALGFWTLRRWVGADLPALAGALLFATHPAKMESVAWISGRPDLWLVVGVLGALWGVALRLRGRNWGIAVEAAGTVVAYLSKEHAIVLPALVVVEAWVCAGRPPLARLKRVSLLSVVAPQVAAAGCYLVARQLLLDAGGTSPAPLTIHHLTLALDSLGALIGFAFWPTSLSVGQGATHMDGGVPVLSTVHLLVASAYLAASGAGIVFWWRRFPAVALSMTLFLALLAPVVGVGYAGAVGASSPRFLYLPLLAPAWLVAVILAAARPRLARGLAVFVGLVIVALGARAVVRSLDYSSSKRFWTYEIEHSPDFLSAHVYFVGTALAERRPRAALRLAHVAFERGRRTRATSQLGLLLGPTMEAVLLLTPDIDRDTLREVGRFARRVREGDHAALTIPSLQIAIELPPGAIEGESQRLTPMDAILVEARVASRVGEDDQAIALTQQALDLEPNRESIYRQLVLITARARRFDLTERVIDAMATRIPHVDVEASRGLLDQARQLANLWQAATPEYRDAAAARFYVLLRAWGRAYGHAQSELRLASRLPPAAALVIGEIAFRAGDREQALRLLQRDLAPEQIEARFDAWELDMGWVDSPVPS